MFPRWGLCPTSPSCRVSRCVSATLRWPSEPGGAEQHPLHLVHIGAREFDPRGQAVHVPQKGLRLAVDALCLAAGIGDHLPQEGPDETHVWVQGARPQGAGVLTRLVFSGTAVVCHRSHLVPCRLVLLFHSTEEAECSARGCRE